MNKIYSMTARNVDGEKLGESWIGLDMEGKVDKLSIGVSNARELVAFEGAGAIDIAREVFKLSNKKRGELDDKMKQILNLARERKYDQARLVAQSVMYLLIKKAYERKMAQDLSSLPPYEDHSHDGYEILWSGDDIEPTDHEKF